MTDSTREAMGSQRTRAKPLRKELNNWLMVIHDLLHALTGISPGWE
jgi:hypothetical protein